MDFNSTSSPSQGGRPHSRKRKVSSHTSDQAAERKRTQNRISQQCAREKQTAYIRQMEAVIDLLKANAEADSEESRYSKLLSAHLKLVEEKRQVDESLFRFRQKLLSVGNLATSSADDPIFDSVGKHDSEENQDHVVAPSEQGAHADQSPTEKTSPNVQVLADDTMVNYGQPNNHMSSRQLAFPTPPSTWNDSPFLFSGGEFGITDLLGTLANLAQPSVPPLLQPSPPRNDSLVVIDNSTIFADQVKSAAMHVMFTSAGGFEADPSLTRGPKLVEKLASVAVEVIGALAGLQTYIYGVHFYKYMEFVMRWRISNRLEDRLAIPVPFRPTPLQAASPDHPMVIDFINWPSIRDQMILYSSSLDLDTMSRDIVLNTVIEIPQQKIAVNIYELFYTHILPRIRGGREETKGSMLHNPEWVYLKVNPPPAHFQLITDPSPTQEALAAEIATRMGLTVQSLLPRGSAVSQGGPDSIESFQKPEKRKPAPCGPRGIMSRALSNFGIDKPCNWRLSRDFARKYPHVDCSLDVSQFEMVSCAEVSLDGANL